MGHPAVELHAIDEYVRRYVRSLGIKHYENC